MSGLNALKLVQAKREKGSSPQHARRQKLSTKLAEQIQLAKAQQSGTEFSPVRIRTVKDETTGQSRKVEVPKKLKPWWWTDDTGKLCITVRYGAAQHNTLEPACRCSSTFLNLGGIAVGTVGVYHNRIC